MARITIENVREMKDRGDPIAMVTAYDATFARLIEGAGADVLLVERAGGGGGTSANSGGLIYLGGGTPVQKAAGFEDDPEEMFKFLVAASSPGADEAKLRLFCPDHDPLSVKCHKDRVADEPETTEVESLAPDHHQLRGDNRIADNTMESIDDQMPGSIRRCRSAAT